MEQKEYSVSEAVRLVGVESHVLRYWEEELQIEIKRTSQGHRVYSEQNIETFRKVRELKEHGLQLKAIRVVLEKEESALQESVPAYDVALAAIPEQDSDHIGQFEAILKRLVGEVIEEKNQKLEQSMRKLMREEFDQLLFQYRDIISEVAVSKEEPPEKKGIFDYIKKMVGR